MKMQRKTNPFDQWERTSTKSLSNITNVYEVVVTKAFILSKNPKRACCTLHSHQQLTVALLLGPKRFKLE
jgi:hypothetical protein